MDQRLALPSPTEDSSLTRINSPTHHLIKFLEMHFHAFPLLILYLGLAQALTILRKHRSGLVERQGKNEVGKSNIMVMCSD